jgi:hypothetical protein
MRRSPGKQDRPLKTKTTEKNFDYAGWFNYFYKQAKARVSSDPDLGRIFCVLFDLSQAIERRGNRLAVDAGFEFPAELSREFNGRLAGEPGGVPLDVLTFLFENGFESYDSIRAADAAVEGGHAFGPYFPLSCATSPTPAQTRPHFLFFYRGDSRDPVTIARDKGAACRADLAKWRNDAHVEEPWHPWKDVAKRGKMWVRLGDNDNDYFTVNSIAMHFHISCAYPMLRMNEINREFKGHITQWSDDQRWQLRNSGRADFCLIKNRRTDQEDLTVCDSTRVFVCTFKRSQLLSPTSGTGNDYPEMGMRSVGVEQIIAYFEIDRYHNQDWLRNAPDFYYDSTLTARGSTMTIYIRKWGWMYGSRGVRNTLGLAYPEALEGHFAQLVGTAFEINHSELLSITDTAVDPATRKQVPAKRGSWAQVSAAKLLR